MDELKKNLSDGNHLLIVPDRFALFHEKAVFEALKVESLFNVEVLSFARFTKKILGGSGAINKIAGTVIVKKLLGENKGRFKCFTRSLPSAGFAGEVYGTIQQLKSCEIAPDTILKTANGEDLLSKKMHDLAIIYEDFNNYLLTNKLYDSSDEFARLIDFDKGLDYLADTHIYICAFDSFTKQTYQIIEKLVSLCKSVNIVLYMDENNKSIYPLDTYQNMLEMGKRFGQTNIIDTPDVLEGQFAHLGKNLFKLKTVALKVKESKISISERRDVEGEIVNAAQIVRQGVIKENLRYKDFAVAIANLAENKQAVSKVFDEFGINYFLDISTLLSETILVQFINKCIDVVKFGFCGSDIVSLAKNKLSGIDFDKACDFEDILLKYNFERDMFKKEVETPEKGWKTYNEIRKLILNNLKPLTIEKSSARQFVLALKKVLEDFGVECQIQLLSDKYHAEGLLAQEQQSRQLMKKLDELLEGITYVLGDSVLSLDEFADIFNSGCAALSISSVPISLDSVFVGDISSSFFDDVHTLFLVGANVSDMPKTLQDCGIILDSEIDKLKDKYNIEPSIKTINLRERFKVYNLVLSPENRLFVSYHTKGMKGASALSPFAEQIKDMFVQQFLGEWQPLKISAQSELGFAEQACNLNFAAGQMSRVLRKIYDGKNIINQSEYATLLSVLKDKNTYFKNYKKLLQFKNFNKLSTSILEDSSKISASGVEAFYTCPFMHFARYGLRLDEKLTAEFDSRTIGNILHKFAEKLHLKVALPADDKKVENVSREVIDTVLTEYDILLKFPKNKAVVNGLKKEAVKLGAALNFQAKNSDFKTVYNEVRFGEGGTLEGIKIKIGSKVLVISGQIDRIDTLGEYFRVIDYKTGSAETSLSELYFGKKIQLYLYQTTLRGRFKPAGGYYLPIKDKLAIKGKSSQWLYRLKGYTLADPKIVLGSDKNLKAGESSQIVEVRRINDKDGEACFHAGNSKLLEPESLIAFADYALELVKKAALNIISGNITPSPLVLPRNPCEYCSFKGICRFDEGFLNTKREPKQKIDEEYIVASAKGGEGRV